MWEGLFKEMKNTVLITGGAGFIGSNLAKFLKQKNPSAEIICLDNLMREGSQLNVSRLEALGIKVVKADIRFSEQILNLPKIDVLIECSAQPSVLAGYDDPKYMIDTNLIGTINCLELAKRDKPEVIFLSTSRVYPIAPVNCIAYEELPTRFDWKKDVLGQGYSFQGINEGFDLNGVRSLYGSTKLSSEHLMLEYFDMFGIKGVVNRLGVVAGPGQMGRIDQGIVGFWIAQHRLEGRLDYIGYGARGKQLRDAIHIDDVCEVIWAQLQSMSKVNGCVFNVGGGVKNTFSLLELTQMVADVVKKKIDVGSVDDERKSDVRIYKTDNSLITKTLGWFPVKNLHDIIEDTNKWMESVVK